MDGGGIVRSGSDQVDRILPLNVVGWDPVQDFPYESDRDQNEQEDGDWSWFGFQEDLREKKLETFRIRK